MKFIVVSGGVLSGLGKGVTSASIGLLLKARGIKVTALKCDMYLNIDAGTMNPIEHGEVFVTHDGVETDQDLGHYERFLNITLSRSNYMTNGQIYQNILDKERALEFEGKCVEPYHAIPPEIISRWYEAGKVSGADLVIIELGGTVGEYEGLLFLESVRRLKLKSPNDVVLVHVGYLPVPPSIGELKSKPLQQSVSLLHSVGLQPDFIVARAEKRVDLKRREKIAFASGISIDDIIANPDVKSIYEVPIILEEQKLAEKVAKKLNLKITKKDLVSWSKMVKKIQSATKKVKIAVVGKYQKTGDYTLVDSYVCVVEALKHASWTLGYQPELTWIDSTDLENKSEEEVNKFFSNIGGILVPQGWGSRGTEGKIIAAKYARENKIPYLGLCFGMQMATVEFARNVLGLKDANSEEVNPKTKYPVIHIMPNQVEYLSKQQYGGTIRLGAWPCLIKKGTILFKAYNKYGKDKASPWFVKRSKDKTNSNSSNIVFERHRHRYEFNVSYKKQFEKRGYLISGTSPDGKLVEAFELKNHPFFVGTQFHPEYESRPQTPHPVFISFIESITQRVKS